MTRLKLAEWTYWLGCVCAVAALVFRSLFFFTDMSVSIYRTTSVKPSSLLQLAVLCFVFTVASRDR